MASFEKFRPNLKPGRILPQGERILFETEAPFDQIVLPMEVVDFLVLCDGQLSVGQIIEKIYHRKGTIYFKAIYKTLVYLKSRGFLENGDELELTGTSESVKEFHFLSFRQFAELPIGMRIFNETDRPTMFYLTAMISILAAILTFQLVNWSWFNIGFLNLHNSYYDGLIFLFVSASILLSLKGFYKCMLLLFLTGRAYNFSLVYNGFAVYFQVKSDSLFLVTNRLYLILFHAAVTLCYFPIVAAVYFFFPNLPYQNEAMSLAFLMFLFDLNPYQESEATCLIKSLFNDDTINKISNYHDHKPLFSLVHPFERNKDYNLYFFFTHYALFWSTLAGASTSTALNKHFDNFIETLKTAPLLDRGAALLCLSFLITLGFVVLNNAVRVFYLALLVPVRKGIMDRLRSRKSQHVRFFSNTQVMEVLEKLPLFSYFSHELLNMILQRSEIKEYKAGSPIIVQGEDGTHLFVLLSGQLQAQRRLSSGQPKKLGEIHPPGIFGEIAVIEDQKRAADVVAVQDSVILEAPAKMLRQIAHNSQYIREIEDFRNAIVVNQFFTSAPVFRDLSETVIHLFTAKGKIENFKKDQIIFNQGDIGDGFYLLLRGAAGVSVNGRPVARVQQGGFFGEISMIADIPRTATLYCMDAVQVLKIGRDSFWEILSHDINMAMFIESVGEMRVREDIEILKSNKAKVA